MSIYNKLHELKVLDNDLNIRLDKFISSKLEGISRTFATNLIKSGYVSSSINGKILKPSYLVSSSEIIKIYVPPPAPIEVVPTKIDLDIVYEDDAFMVINKKAKMVVHPGAGNFSNTLVNALLGYSSNLSSIGGKLRPGIVHRLDKDTSGLIIIAKNDVAHQNISEQFKSRTVKKVYYAITFGEIKKSKFVVSLPIGRSLIDRKKMAVITNKNIKSREAYTEFEVLLTRNGISLVKVMPKTGRTHQIRVHLSHIGFPIVGDILYADSKLLNEVKSKKYFNDRLWLHAASLEFLHPVTKKVVKFDTGLPLEFDNFIKSL